MKGTENDSSVIAQHYDDGITCKYECVSFLYLTSVWFQKFALQFGLVSF